MPLLYYGFGFEHSLKERLTHEKEVSIIVSADLSRIASPVTTLSVEFETPTKEPIANLFLKMNVV